MKSPFIYSDDNKRYHTYNYYLRHRFGKKVFKVSLDAGFSCPNRDGSKGVGGCIYCSDKRSGDFAGNSCDDISVQFDNVREVLHKKWSDAVYIPYFQAGTNTYGDFSRQKELFTRAVNFKNAVGLSVATRGDCIDERVADLFYELSKDKYVTVELGLQTSNDLTAQKINRGYLYKTFTEGYMKLKNAGIRVCVHIIDGLPGETQDDMLKTAYDLSNLRPDALKIHLLHVIRGTRLEALLDSGCYIPLTFYEYIDTVVRQLELLPPETVIERITGDGDKSKLLAPLWSRDKIRVLGTIDKEMANRITWQGRLFSADDLHLS